MSRKIKTKSEEFFDSISKISCISKLQSADKKILKEIILSSFNSFTNNPRLKHMDFTPHDKSHIIDIYKIVSCLFVDGFSGSERLSPKELLILDLAILFHDVGMHGYELGEAQRSCHAYTAYDFVINNLNSFCSDCSQIGGDDGKTCVAEICGAHSDAYGDHSEINIANVRTHNNATSTIGKIRVLLLAVILRIADELDICYDRISGENFSEPANDATESIWESLFKHWQMLELFNLPGFNKDTNNIEIKVRKEGFTKSKYKTPFEQKFFLILSHIKKLHSFDADEKDYFKDALNGEGISLQPDVVKLLDKYTETPPAKLIKFCSSLSFTITYDDEGCGAWCKFQHNLFCNRKMLEDIISSGKKGHIIEHKCLKYLSGPEIKAPCIYDYMNFHKIIDAGEKQSDIAKLVNNSFGNIIKAIKDEASDDFDKKSILVGVDSIGSLLATMLSNKTMIPLISYAPKSRSQVYPHIEMDNTLADTWYKSVVADKDYIFIVCDTIYSFDSISACLEDLDLVKNGENIDKDILKKIYVFSLFDRRPVKDDMFFNSHNRKKYYNELKFAFKIYPVIDVMKTNFVKKSNCIFCMLKKEK